MKQFYLLDHSLIDVGGHHYEYAVQILQAAEASGYRIVLGCHEKFSSQSLLPKTWNVVRLFRHSTYNRYAKHADKLHDRAEVLESGQGARIPTNFKQAMLNRLYDIWYRHGYDGLSKQYQHNCQQLFFRFPSSVGDIVFLPTMSAFDLQCLADYLKSTPATRIVDWHMQFHFNFFEGREPGFSQQEPRRIHAAWRFSQALQAIPKHRLHFYSTTQRMTAQFQRLEVADFQLLPYPTNEAFRTSPHSESHSKESTIHLVCPGHVRREKGRQQLADFFADAYEKYFQTGRMQLHVQLDLRRFLQCLPSRIVQKIRADARQSPEYAPVVTEPHPLAKDQYVRLIRDANIGLLLYDSKTYYARCSGILVEMLTAGVPVIVPAGCWLSEQIAEANYQHLDRCREEFQPLESIKKGRTSNSSDRCLAIPDRGQHVEESFSLSRDVRSLMVSFHWDQQNPVGTYVRIELEQFDVQMKSVDRSSNIEGQRTEEQAVRTHFAIYPETTTVKVIWSNAYHTWKVSLAHLEYSVPQEVGLAFPSGAVGLTLAEPSQIQRTLEELVEYYEHYRSGTQKFSVQWYQRHAPARTVEILERQAGSNASFHQISQEQAA
jgi:hypothetical protein